MAMQNQAPNSAPMPTTHKDYVTVVARHELGGHIRPVAYQLPGGSPVKIDCVTDERQAASLKSGGQGTRYTCKVTVDEVQSDVYLFHDEELWFMEATRCPRPLAGCHEHGGKYIVTGDSDAGCGSGD